MNQQPDKLFRDKLQGYQQPVPARAWNRVSENLGGKNRRRVWLRIAATVLVIMASGIFLFPLLTKNGGQSVSHNTQNPPLDQSGRAQRDSAEAASPKNDERVKPEEKKQIADAASAGQRYRRALPEKQKKPAAPEKNAEHAPEEKCNALPLVADEEPVVISDESNVDVTPESASDPMTASSSTPESVTIVFTTEEVNQKYLTKKSDADATTEAKETSGLKRLLDKASDLKNNQDLLGELRQKKNEILAMNFRNDKRNTEND